MSPFTLSHPAAVIGLRRSGLPVVGLVAGSMVPDVPMFGLVPYGYDLAHSLLGLVTVDLAAGSFAVLVWALLVRGVLASASPRWVRVRLRGARLTRREWLLVPLAAVVGAATHLGWDALTHEGRWGDRHVAWLHDEFLGHAGYHWAQAVSSVLGLAVAALYGAATLARRNPVGLSAAAPAVPVARWSIAAVAGSTAGIGLVVAVGRLDDGLHAAAFDAAERSMTTLIVGLVLAGAVWRYAAARP